MLWLAVFSILLRSANAIFADEAYNIDYHYPLLGEPQESTTFFHRPSTDSRASLIYTLSEQHGLGAVNPKDGAIVWRHLLQNKANNTFLRAVDGGAVVVSGIEDQVTAWSAGDGKLAWTYKTSGELADVEVLEFDLYKDTIALSKGSRPTVARLDGMSGSPKWEHSLDAVDVPYQLSVSPTKLFVVLIHKTMLGYIKLRVISLDLKDGKQLDEYTLSSENELSSLDKILMVGANSASPIIAYTDASNTNLHVNVLGSKSISKFPIKHKSGESVKHVKLHAPYHATSVPHFLAYFETEKENWAEVFHINTKSASVEKAYSLPAVAGQSVFSTSTIDANVYFTRISQSEIVTVSSASHGILGRWPVSALGTLGKKNHQTPEFAVSELSVKGDSVSAIRCAIWMSTGELVLSRDGATVWSRPEALADIVSARFGVLTTAETIEYAQKLIAPSNPIQAYIQRITRHLQDLSLLASRFETWAASVFGVASDSKNTFGFDQTIILTTRKGHLFGLEAGSSGRIAYSVHGIGATDGVEDVEDIDSMTDSNSTASYTYLQQNGEVVGYADPEAKIKTWTFTPRQGDEILNIFPRPVEDPVASIGIVLGNRKVLYKYLNPNLAMIVTGSKSHNAASFTVIDTVSGAALHSASHTGVDLNMPIVGTMSESWFAYSYTAQDTGLFPKGHLLVAGELYESLISNDRGLLDTAETYSSFSTSGAPFVLSHTYHISEPISAMAVTRTAQGITSRQLLAVLPESNGIVGIPRQALDPRRPKRDPTKEEQMEGLVKYNPVLEFDPKWYLNHKREVLGIEKILASPAILESTSLIFAYGFDIFGTRLSPSFNFDMLGKDFNKFQMLATVFALAVATLVVGPLVARKQVNARWTLHA